MLRPLDGALKQAVSGVADVGLGRAVEDGSHRLALTEDVVANSIRDEVVGDRERDEALDVILANLVSHRDSQQHVGHLIPVVHVLLPHRQSRLGLIDALRDGLRVAEGELGSTLLGLDVCHVGGVLADYASHESLPTEGTRAIVCVLKGEVGDNLAALVSLVGQRLVESEQQPDLAATLERPTRLKLDLSTLTLQGLGNLENLSVGDRLKACTDDSKGGAVVVPDNCLSLGNNLVGGAKLSSLGDGGNHSVHRLGNHIPRERRLTGLGKGGVVIEAVLLKAVPGGNADGENVVGVGDVVRHDMSLSLWANESELIH